MVGKLDDIAVLVLDGRQRTALAAVRSLGRRGLAVAVADSVPSTLAGSSKYCGLTLVHPSIERDRDGFIAWLTEIVIHYPNLVILPVTDVSVPACLIVKGLLPDMQSALPPTEAYNSLIDKFALRDIAAKFGLRMPATASVSRLTIRDRIENVEQYPVVVKPRQSAYRLASGVTVRRGVAYAHDQKSLHRVCDQMLLDDRDEVLVQQFVDGYGMGVFTLYSKGVAKVFFAHRRLREKPPSGGVSVLSESSELDPDLRDRLRGLLDAQDWNGPAMAEFKLSQDGTPWMIEVNARLWGSVQLAVNCSIDFPYYCYQIATGQDVLAPQIFPRGRQLRWLLGDLDSLYLRLRDSEESLAAKMTAVAKFSLPFRVGRKSEVMQISDPGPGLFEIFEYAKAALR